MPKGFIKLADLQPKRPRRMYRTKPLKQDVGYRQVWRVVDGAVRDCFQHHPEYLGSNIETVIRRSITKRVVGAIMGYASEMKRGADPGEPSSLAAEEETPCC